MCFLRHATWHLAIFSKINVEDSAVLENMKLHTLTLLLHYVLFTMKKRKEYNEPLIS